MQQTAKRIQRQENILYSLKKCDYLTTSQLQTIHKLKGKRNACKILQRMEQEEGLVKSFRNEEGEKVYYLSKLGAETVSAEKIRRKTHLVNHFLMRNQYFIYAGMPSSWETEMQINNKIVADAVYKMKNKYVFVEVDNLQTFKANIQKIKRYKEIQQQSKDEFTLVWVTSTHARKQRLERHLEGLNSIVYLYSDLI